MVNSVKIWNILTYISSTEKLEILKQKFENNILPIVKIHSRGFKKWEIKVKPVRRIHESESLGLESIEFRFKKFTGWDY